MPNDLNTRVINEFRANKGRVGGWFEGARLLLLTTTGTRSGRPHTAPIGYLPDGGGRVLIIASAGGAPRDPDWYHNLVADPVVTVEDGAFTYEAEATLLTGGERDRAFARAVEADPGWAEYQAKTSRVLPVVALTAIPGPPRMNASSMGDALELVHGAFRRELGLIRDEVAKSGPILGAQLRVNCLTLCTGLSGHHTNEDEVMFAGVGHRRPDLAPVLDRLRAEHEAIAVLLAHLRRVLDAPDLDRATLQAEVDRLATELERHLDYEEEQLIPILDAPT
ncbi:nitroreductase/quinone reductase family protein [Micromonospora sp. WMMA1363]|uniref:nitroreductase/quinone reductase family protein n=1 Tax=Micromonospora sp. WMMA1363 TaxID=3053985 RepID=UPI00259C8A68|nr:nitroreductase/quinone reductase family protein [Micromonospora sp. WMMA1363]MDM4722011.1 nitroreductase/quinone reductase family protein [Micromonospora sp. WMMA1363]